MKIFGYRLEFRKEEREKKVPDYISSTSEALNFGSLFNSYGAMNISSVYRAVELIADSVAILPIKIKENTKKSKAELENHYLKVLFSDRYSNMSRYTLIKLLIQSVLLKGNGFAYIERAKDGTATSIQFLDSSDVQIHYNPLKPKELFYTCNTVKGKIEPVNIIHLVKNSYDGINGISVISFASRAVKLSNATENSANGFFENGCNLSGVLTVEGQLSDKQRTDIRNSWQQAYTNGGNGLAVLQGNMRYQSVQLSAVDSQLLESRQYNVQDIARFFGISPVLLGDLSKSSYATIEAAQNEFLLHTLQPYVTMIEQEFTRKLLKPSEQYLEVCLDETYILKTDKAALANYYGTLLDKGILCIDEVRTELGYSPIGATEHLVPYTDVAKNNVLKK